MKKPNFFIIGAPKCGTTSIAAWLSEHPQVFMSRPKEPHHFNTDSRRSVTKRSEYERLFRGATERHVAVGEASVWYLESRTAVTAIEEYADSPKYVVCLRNPVEMAPSLHEQQVHNGNEDVYDFHTAWNLSDQRLDGTDVPWRCRDEPRHLAYKQMGTLGRQCERLLAAIPPGRIHIVLLDDLRADPGMVYRQLLGFVGLDDDGRSEFPTYNSAKIRRFGLLHEATRLAGAVKRRVGLGRLPSIGLLDRVSRWNTQYRPRPPLAESVLDELRNFFRNDVAVLSGLLNRDLTHWCP
jgi:hypothetical protein